jgi:hypothetical protein
MRMKINFGIKTTLVGTNQSFALVLNSLTFQEVLSPMLPDFTKPTSFCPRYLFRVASVTALGVSSFSQEFLLNSPMPTMTPTLNITSIVNHPEEPYNFMGIYKSNSTIIITIEYDNISAGSFNSYTRNFFNG